MKKTVVLAWGNDFHRDDGAGRRAAIALRELGLPGVDVHDFNQLVPEHAELLVGVDRAIFLDAFPAAPGQGPLLLPLHDQKAINLPRSCFGHAVQPTEIAALAADLYDAHPECWLAAIPGFEFDLGEELSEATSVAATALVQMVVEKVGRSGSRQFIRHPVDIPIEVQLEDVVSNQREYLVNISAGGLCFHSSRPLNPGSSIRIRIPLLHPVFEARGQVVWCEKEGAAFDVGVIFLQEREVFRTRMVEQICHIEAYKKEVLTREGRPLTSEEAAVEWIRRNAADFPRPTAAPDHA